MSPVNPHGAGAPGILLLFSIKVDRDGPQDQDFFREARGALSPSGSPPTQVTASGPDYVFFES